MGSDQLHLQKNITCALCAKSEETEVTGPLSSKDNISAHQNCLLFASAIYCKNSPTYDDLFGFDVDDVKKERKRGRRLFCHYCKKSGATAGCDVKRCKRSYHYPCAIEDRARVYEDRFILFCELHDPESPPKSSLDCQNPNMKRSDRRDSDSSSGSSEVSSSKKKKMMSPIWLDSDDDDDIECLHPQVESDIEDYKPPNLNNLSTPDPESKSHCAEPSPSTTGALNLTSAQKACGSTDNPGDLNDRRTRYPCVYRGSKSRSLEVGNNTRTVNSDSDDERPTSTDRVVAPEVSDPKDSMLQKQPNQSTPVPKNTRPCEKLKPSTTEADDDTDIDSEESQSLLASKLYHITIPCRVILDSGLSAESEHSLEPSSPAGSAPAVVSTSPESVPAPEQKKTPSTSRTSPPPQAPTTEPVSPSTNYDMPTLDYSSCELSGQPGSPQHSSPTVDVPGVSSSPGRPTAADASDVDITVKSKSSATLFWTRCNEAGWTKEIFSELVSQLSSLGERVQSPTASHQDYDVALKVLGASGRLPCIITQLEQDLEKQEQDLKRKKAALRDAKAVLDV